VLDFQRDVKRATNPKESTGAIDLSRNPDKKEKKMKKLINLKVVLMIGLICFGCSGMSAEQRKDGTYDLRSGVGDKPFVGGYSDEAHDLAWFQAHGR
jgi:hypothetical protein